MLGLFASFLNVIKLMNKVRSAGVCSRARVPFLVTPRCRVLAGQSIMCSCVLGRVRSLSLFSPRRGSRRSRNFGFSPANSAWAQSPLHLQARWSHGQALGFQRRFGRSLFSSRLEKLQAGCCVHKSLTDAFLCCAQAIRFQLHFGAKSPAAPSPVRLLVSIYYVSF